jgi:hypothetical protein
MPNGTGPRPRARPECLAQGHVRFDAGVQGAQPTDLGIHKVSAHGMQGRAHEPQREAAPQRWPLTRTERRTRTEHSLEQRAARQMAAPLNTGRAQVARAGRIDEQAMRTEPHAHSTHTHTHSEHVRSLVRHTRLKRALCPVLIGCSAQNRSGTDEGYLADLVDLADLADMADLADLADLAGSLS